MAASESKGFGPIPPCPICEGPLVRVQEKLYQVVVVCADCHTRIAAPGSAWHVRRLKQFGQWQDAGDTSVEITGHESDTIFGDRNPHLTVQPMTDIDEPKLLGTDTDTVEHARIITSLAIQQGRIVKVLLAFWDYLQASPDFDLVRMREAYARRDEGDHTRGRLSADELAQIAAIMQKLKTPAH